MKIKVYSLERSSKDAYKQMQDEYVKMAGKYATVACVDIEDKGVLKAQKSSVSCAKESYTKAYEPYANGFCVALHERGESLDSVGFSKLFDGFNPEVNFFIGGAYGFEDKFLDKCDRTISLSQMTFGHKLAKVVLCEQIFRALSIVNNHPYHK